MQPQRAGGCFINFFLIMAGIFGLIAFVLVVVPYYVEPALFHKEARLQLAENSPLLAQSGVRRASRMPRAVRGVGCQSHVVQAGETLRKIAQRFETSEIAVAMANDLQTDVLKSGQSLVICGTDQIIGSISSDVDSASVRAMELDETVDVLMQLTYPTAVQNRKPHWITLTLDVPEGATDAPLGTTQSQSTSEARSMSRVTLPVPDKPRLSVQQKAELIEQWLSARLTGANVVARADMMSYSQPLGPTLAGAEPLTWKWLFVPSDAGEYLFGLDMYSAGQFEVLDEDDTLLETVRTSGQPLWSHDFTVSVDEFFGIPRQWFLVASGLAAVLNLLLGFLQILRII